jgi:two-component SAPR family response regulator
VRQAKNISDAYTLLLSTKPDIAFLDIEMSHGSGVEFLKKNKIILN